MKRILKGSLKAQAPETWWFDTWGGGEGKTISVKCANGHISTLWSRRDGKDSTHHTIADDGTVTPSVVCPREKCDWHENIVLVDWKPLPEHFRK